MIHESSPGLRTYLCNGTAVNCCSGRVSPPFWPQAVIQTQSAIRVISRIEALIDIEYGGLTWEAPDYTCRPSINTATSLIKKVLAKLQAIDF